jgi:hypothetical protein
LSSPSLREGVVGENIVHFALAQTPRFTGSHPEG